MSLVAGKPPRVEVDGTAVHTSDIQALGVNFTEGEDPTLTIVRVKRPLALDVSGDADVVDLNIGEMVLNMNPREIETAAYESLEPLGDQDVTAAILGVIAERLGAFINGNG